MEELHSLNDWLEDEEELLELRRRMYNNLKEIKEEEDERT